MAADVEQNELLFNQRNGESNTVAVGKAACIAAFEPALQGMQLQVRRKGVFLQVENNFLEAFCKIRMALEKHPRLPQKPFRSNNAVH